MRASKTPGEPGEQERNPDLDPREQERVVVRARVAGRRDVPTNVQSVGEASAYELRDEREQPEGKPGQKALVATRPIHAIDGTQGDYG
jgi:hypothetical protein